MNDSLMYVVVFLLLWNVVTFVMMGLDKLKSIRGSWRVKERTILWSSFLLGAAGCCLGAIVFRHKTSKLKFQFFLPLFLVLNIVIIYLFSKSGILF